MACFEETASRKLFFSGSVSFSSHRRAPTLTTEDIFGWVGHELDGKLAIEAVAGEGGFGIVYRALHLGFQEHLAVKCLKVPPQLKPAQRDYFLRTFTNEARLMRKLIRATTGVVEALDVGVATSPKGQWTPYISMEWLSGESLDRRLEEARHNQNHQNSILDALDLLAPIADALSIAHTMGIIHRDIKPANLFLTQVASGVLLKILDFGIAGVMTDLPGIDKATLDDAGALTPGYCAPEQFSTAFGATGPWTDVYSLTLVLLELISGRPVRAGCDLMGAFTMATDPKRRPTFASLGVDADPRAEALLEKALEQDVLARIADVKRLWNDLREIFKTKSLSRKTIVNVPWVQGPGANNPTLNIASDQTISINAFGESEQYLIHTGQPVAKQNIDRISATVETQYEDRKFTLLMLDTAELETLFESSPPDQAEKKIGAEIDRVAAHIEAAGGLLVQRIDGRLTAVFGAHRVHSNDTERALLTALDCSQMPVGSTSVALKGIVHTGLGFTITSVGAAGSNVALRGPILQQANSLIRLACAGEILASDFVKKRLTGSFNF